MTQEKIEAITTAFKDTDITAKSFNEYSLFSGLDLNDDVWPLRAWAIEKGMKEAKFKDIHRRWRISGTLGGNPGTVEDYVKLYVAKESITVRFNGLLDTPRVGSVASYIDIVSLGRDLRLLNAKLEIGFKDNRIEDALNKWLEDSKQARLEAAFQTVCSDQPVCGEGDWLRLANALADTNVISANCVARILQTAIWQVKRKLADDPAFPVHDHLMPILCGPQGSGKTQVTMKFFSPISDLVAPTNFTEITDGRNFDLWGFPVLFLDEMEAADRSDVEAIKNAITRSEKSGRTLYTGATNTVRNRATCWGCTNGTVGDKIADPTGLRRFGPIHVKHAPTAENVASGLPVVDWGTINSIDYSAL